MITVMLMAAHEKRRLYIIDGAICHFRFDDPILIINDIMSIKKGQGWTILNMIIERFDPTKVIAKCPIGWDSNNWYERRGFILEEVSGKLNVWVLHLRKDLY